MCGIVGYIGERDVIPLLIKGLKMLEYRGYDSAGVAVIGNDGLFVKKCKGKICTLEEVVSKEYRSAKVGIGHTRWATHGIPSETNAHPHTFSDIAVVHNGIIENYEELRKELEMQGYGFVSDTDTEVIPFLLDFYIKKGKDFLEAMFCTKERLCGSYAICAICARFPNEILIARKESPIVVGFGKNEKFVASDVTPLLDYTKEVIFLDDDEVASVRRDNFFVFKGRKSIKKSSNFVNWTPDLARKKGFKHFMKKEIFEQPEAVENTFRSRIKTDDLMKLFDENKGISLSDLENVRRIVLCACGTSYHACLVGKFMFERFCRIPTEVDIASEFRYRDPILNKNTLSIFVSQSGETADTIGALRVAKDAGSLVVSICNVLGSTITRESLATVYTFAGPEISVASTKAFTTQIVVLYLISLYLSHLKGTITKSQFLKMKEELSSLPIHMREVLKLDEKIFNIAKVYYEYRNFLYLGRGLEYPLALEGALKLKEISYIHAEAYPGGEMKHGPIALIDSHMPVFFVISKENVKKMTSNMQEVLARGGRILGVCEEGLDDVKTKNEDFIPVPQLSSFLKAVLFAIPLQLFAYHVAALRGTDIDQPRNLAKSVTVE